MALLAGTLVSLQNIFNAKVNEHVGSWTTTTLVLGMGFLASLAGAVIFAGQSGFPFSQMKLWYWFSGMIGVGVVICLVQGIRLLSPTYAISIVLTSQLMFAILWDSLGLLGLVKVPFTPKQLIGVLVIVTGVLLFKVGGRVRQSTLPNGYQ